MPEMWNGGREAIRVFVVLVMIFASGYGRAQSAGKETPAPSALCGAWLPATEEGKLDASFIDESSGLVVSRRFDKIYHINDSGDGPFFYVTDRKGAGTRKVSIEGFKPRDVEEIALGPCPVGETGQVCLAVGDIGDNLRMRKSIEVVFLEEVAEFGKSVKPVLRVSLQYPDGARNAEAFGVLPNGDLVIVTKEGGRIENATPAQVYRAARKDIIEAKPKKPVTLKRIGQIDVPALVKDKGLGGLVTAMSMADDGRRFVLLTYGKALEFKMDLSIDTLPGTGDLKVGIDYGIVPLTQLWQQEAIGYDKNNRDLYYSSEVVGLFKRAPSPLMKIRCK